MGKERERKREVKEIPNSHFWLYATGRRVDFTAAQRIYQLI